MTEGFFLRKISKISSKKDMKKIRTVGRSSSSQATQLHKGSAHTWPHRHRHQAFTHFPPWCPGGRSAPARGQQKMSPRDLWGYQLNLHLQKWNRSKKRQQERINLQTKRCLQRGKGEQRENRLKYLTKKLTCRKQRNKKWGESSPWWNKRERSHLINIIIQCLISAPVSLFVQSREIFLSTVS